ncbi:MAG: sensor histidine kinase [Gammaproteobacteria bacterium]
MAFKAERRQPAEAAKRRLFFWLLAFFIGIALPVYFLMYKVYSQLDNETWYRQRSQAELLVERIERQLLEKLQPEQERPIAEYSFFNVLENPLLQSTTVNFSPLSEMPPKSDMPGLVGYFQIDPDGSFHIPALPELRGDAQSGLSAGELAARLTLKQQLLNLLTKNAPEAESTVTAAAKLEALQEESVPVPKPAIQANRFDDYFRSDRYDRSEADSIEEKRQEEQAAAPAPLKSEQTLSDSALQALNIETSQWEQRRKIKKADSLSKNTVIGNFQRQARKETVKIPDQSSAGAVFNRQSAKMTQEDSGRARKPAQQNETSDRNSTVVGGPVADEKDMPVNILSFESEVSPMQLITLDNGYWCFYRNAWNGKSRYVQGLIVGAAFFETIVRPLFDAVDGFPLTSLLLVDKGRVLQHFKKAENDAEVLLFRRVLLPPFQQIETIVNTGSLVDGSGRKVLDLVGIALFIIVLTGFMLFYRLGAGQIELAKQQRNFISAVSHELKTPLTSIRMYSEMLRADWVADEAKKKGYYDFIYYESERLSRLIGNVLQLARLDNHQKKVQWVEIDAGQLLQSIRSKISAQIEAADYRLNLIPPDIPPFDVHITVDEDAFFQIMINLVDNAIKFSRQAHMKSIDIGYRIGDKGKELVFFVRDYGPGIDKEQRKKIFRLFYRAGDELTRTQPGTGIGLALVVQLAETMDATVDQINRSPGAEFQLKFSLT